MPWTSKGLRKRLERDIRRDYPWLFQESDAVVLPLNPYKQVLDYANVTVAVSDFLFQFTRGRDEFHVSIAPAHELDDWYELGEAIDLARDIGATSESAGNYTMSDFERLFRANIEGLKLLFSQREYIRTSRRRFASLKRSTALSRRKRQPVLARSCFSNTDPLKVSLSPLAIYSFRS